MQEYLNSIAALSASREVKRESNVMCLTAENEESDIKMEEDVIKENKKEEDKELEPEANGFTETDDSDEEGQLRIAEEENYTIPEVG